MHNLLTSKYFLVVTGLFLLITITVIWLFFPPALKVLNENKAAKLSLNEQIQTSQAAATGVEDLVSAKTTIAELYDKASLALPSSPSADLLLLQFDGLTESLGLDATITVPFSEGALASQVAAPAAPASDEEIKPGSGSAGGTQPIITSSDTGTKTDWSLSGEWDYPTVLNLLTKLKTFGRWNTVTSIDISAATDKSTATISGKVYWTPEGNLQFSGSVKELLTKAKILFDSYQTYTTIPDVTKEGNFGKSNPFQ
ncbi:MAG: hypothetical protein Q8Q05_02110 [bacterium]|nr:hypothetical protein [bacterium]